jgi:hypothetical protein
MGLGVFNGFLKLVKQNYKILISSWNVSFKVLVGCASNQKKKKLRSLIPIFFASFGAEYAQSRNQTNRVERKPDAVWADS